MFGAVALSCDVRNERVLKLTSITKTFGGVRALSDVSFELAAGEVHALVGENGAGKSTLIKIITGSVRPDEGRMAMNGREIPLGSIRASEAAGIAVIHQESVAFPHLNAQDNIFVGREPRLAGILLDRPRMLRETRA